MRISVLTKIVLVAAAALIIMPGTPAQAQRYRGTRNSEVGTIGDVSASKFSARTSRSYGISFTNLGLFVDSEVFVFPGAPSPFIFPLPDFSGSGWDFDGKTFDEYLDAVATNYRISSAGEYLFRFQLQNEFSVANPDFLPPTFEQVLQVHRNDFTAAGGYLPLGGLPTTPFVPLPGDVAPDPDPPFTPLPTGDSQDAQSVPVVSTVPEPATLALLTLGATALLTRTRRR